MCSQDLITTETHYNYMIQPEGIKVFESGGLIKHLKELSLEKLENNRIKNIELDKFTMDLKLAKWNVKTKQIILIIAIFGVLIAALAFVWPILFK